MEYLCCFRACRRLSGGQGHGWGGKVYELGLCWGSELRGGASMRSGQGCGLWVRQTGAQVLTLPWARSVTRPETPFSSCSGVGWIMSPQSYVHILSPDIGEWDYIWKKSLCRCNEGSRRWDVLDEPGVLSPLVSSLEETQTQRWGHMKTEAETEVSPTLQMGHKEEMAQKQLWWRPPQHRTLDAGRGRTHSQADVDEGADLPISSVLRQTVTDGLSRKKAGWVISQTGPAGSPSIIIHPVSDVHSFLLAHSVTGTGGGRVWVPEPPASPPESFHPSTPSLLYMESSHAPTSPNLFPRETMHRSQCWGVCDWERA